MRKPNKLFDLSVNYDNIIKSTHNTLVSQASNNIVNSEEKLVDALNLLCKASILLDKNGLYSESEEIVELMEIIAQDAEIENEKYSRTHEGPDEYKRELQEQAEDEFLDAVLEDDGVPFDELEDDLLSDDFEDVD